MASTCTFVTSGQVASIVNSLRAFAASRIAGLTPWAEYISTPPSGTSSTRSTKVTPRSVKRSTTARLWTISW